MLISMPILRGLAAVLLVAIIITFRGSTTHDLQPIASSSDREISEKAESMRATITALLAQVDTLPPRDANIVRHMATLIEARRVSMLSKDELRKSLMSASPERDEDMFIEFIIASLKLQRAKMILLAEQHTQACELEGMDNELMLCDYMFFDPHNLLTELDSLIEIIEGGIADGW